MRVKFSESLALPEMASPSWLRLSLVCGLVLHIWFEGKDIANKPPAFSINQGLAHIPEDRIGVGSAPNLSLTSNIIMKRYNEEPISKKWQPITWLLMNSLPGLKMNMTSRRQTSKLRCANSLAATSETDSGSGAFQHSTAPGCMQPTRGLDVGAIEGVQQLLLQQREQGCAILLVSEDLDELLALSDRIAVMYEGEVVNTLCQEDFDLETIGLMMTAFPTPRPHSCRPIRWGSYPLMRGRVSWV